MKQHNWLINFFKIIPFLFLLTACYRPPFNNFHDQPKIVTALPYAILGAAIGTGVAAAASSDLLGGALIGGGAGAAFGFYKRSPGYLIKQLSKQSVQVVVHNDILTMIVPTDKFFVFDTAELNELRYNALVNILRLVQTAPPGPIYVAGFTDSVGSKQHKKWLSDQRAQAMAAFLWAYGFKAYCLDAAGYADKNDIADNNLVHGSAMNRRVEIQWKINPPRL